MKLFSKKDLIFLVLILAIAGILFTIFKNDTHGALYEVSVNGKTVRRESIYKKSRTELDCGAVIVCDGEGVYFDSSNCPDLVCVNTGRLTREGEWAACLPNEVFLKVVSK
jgi:hypothetical protein